MNIAITNTGEHSPVESKAAESADMFPPFPQVPSRATVVPFSVFQERGICVSKDAADKEVDGFGIPTVALPVYRDVQHVEIEQQSLTIPFARFIYDGTVHGNKWWLAWEQFEKTRVHASYNPRMSRMDRIYAAASSFKNGRRWPFERPGSSGPRYLWDQFCIFIGTLGYPPAWERTDKPKQNEAQNQPDYSDEEDISEGRTVTVNSKSTSDRTPNGKKHIIPTRPPYAYYDVKPVLIDSDEGVQSLLEMDRLKREERLIDFLDDPERAVKVYLSFYMRDQGLMWLDRNLDTAPRVVMHFFKYLLNNRVFPENERKLQNALKVIERSLKELPLTSIISKIFPDEFGKACKENWNGHRDSLDPGFSRCPHDETEVDITKLQEDCDEISLTADLASDRIPITNPSGVRHLEILDTSDLFKQLLAPTTAFPSTHNVGYVEQSLRRITQVLYPGTFFDPYAQIRGGTDQELETMLAKIVLSPWLDSGLDEYDQPHVIKEPSGIEEGQLEPHISTEDEIAVLVSVSSNNLGMLKEAIGMGLAGIWVQVKPTNEKSPAQRRKMYWYVDSLDLVVPSNWTR